MDNDLKEDVKRGGLFSTIVGKISEIEKFVRDHQSVAHGVIANGAANLKLFMNAAGTLTEWASGVIVKLESRSMTAAGAPTNVAYTGYGFLPSALLILTQLDGKPKWSIGIGNAATKYGVIIENNANVTLSSFFGQVETSAGNSQSFTVNSLDADGFTLRWTKTGAPAAGTAYLLVLALR